MSFTVTKIDDSAGAGATGVVNEARARFVRMYGGAAIVKGHCVGIDPDESTHGLGNTVIKADSDVTATGAARYAVGVAAETITAAGFIKIQVGGYCSYAKLNSGSGDALNGQLLVASDTAGQMEAIDTSAAAGAGGDNLPTALCLDDSGSVGAATSVVFLLNPFNL